MSVKSGQAVTVLFATANATTGAAADASSTPTGTLYVNGTANGATVTVTNITTGVYKAALTLPSLTAGDVVSLRIAATVSAVAGEGIVWQEVADTKRVSDLNDLGGVAQTGDSYARLGAPAGASVSADIANVPTVSEFEARTLPSASYFDPAAVATTTADAVATRLTGYQVNIQATVQEDGSFTLYQGYDYNSADDRAVEFALATPDFTGATTALRFDGDTYAGSVVNPGATTQLLRFEFTAAQTTAMTAGYHAYRLEVTKAGRLLLEETGMVHVKE